MQRTLAVWFLFILSGLPLCAQTSDLAALAKVKTAALVVQATTSISCGDGSEGTCVRKDPDIVTKVTTIVDGIHLWDHFEKMDATKADAILEFTVKDAATTYGRISFSVRDADNNKVIYSEFRDLVLLENDITRIINHFLKVVDDAKKRPVNIKKP
jgi:hypothetical protein